MTVVATAGHVDHGKSTLVRALTGTDPDRWAEERRRGLTIDLGFATTTLPSGRVVEFVDVPGHHRFLPNMLAGVGGVPACLFVVDATEGWRAQSEEHLRILDGLGMSRGVVALTRIATLDPAAVDRRAGQVRAMTGGTFLADAPHVGVDAPAGIGLPELVGALDDMVAGLPPPIDRHRARLWVDRSFTLTGAGTVVTGTTTGGSLRVGDTVEIHPGGRTARIRGLRRQQHVIDVARPGHRVAVNLRGVDVDEVPRGSALVPPTRWHVSREVDAVLRALDAPDRGVGGRGDHHLHLGSNRQPVRLRTRSGGPIPPGATGVVRLRLLRPLPLRPGDRFVVRESGRAATVATGEVLDVDPQRPLARARPDRSVARVVAERGAVEVDELARLVGEDVPPTVGHWVVDPAHGRERRRRLNDALAAGTLDLAALDPLDRAIVAELDGVAVTGGTVRPAEVAARDAVAVARAIETMTELLAEHPGGVTIAQARDAWGVRRREAVELVEWMDAHGITRRCGDLRVPGPRLDGRPVTAGGSPSSRDG